VPCTGIDITRDDRVPAAVPLSAGTAGAFMVSTFSSWPRRK
jgi:hypothetical protein